MQKTKSSPVNKSVVIALDCWDSEARARVLDVVRCLMRAHHCRVTLLQTVGRSDLLDGAGLGRLWAFLRPLAASLRDLGADVELRLRRGEPGCSVEVLLTQFKSVGGRRRRGPDYHDVPARGDRRDTDEEEASADETEGDATPRPEMTEAA